MGLHTPARICPAISTTGILALLERAQRAVEIPIEQSEAKAMSHPSKDQE